MNIVMKTSTKFMKPLGVLGLLVLFGMNIQAQERKLNLSGYSSVAFSTAFGDAANEQERIMHERNGGDPDIIEEGTDISYPGMNLFLNSQFSDKLTFQSEIFFEVDKDEFNVDMEQLFLKYGFSEKFNLTTGQFITPLGYLSRNQRNLDYLNYSYKIRDMINEEFGLTPFRTLGLQANGTFEAGSMAIMYWVAYGGARGTTPAGKVNETQIGNVEHSSPSLTVNLELYFPMSSGDLNIGMGIMSTPSIKSIYIDSLGKEVDILEELDPSERMDLSETIFAPYIRYDASKFQVFAEYHINTLKDELGNTGSASYEFTTLSAQILYKTKIKGKSVYPYLRYDKLNFANDNPDPYYGLIQRSGDGIIRTHAANREQIMIGAAFDLFPNNRIKLEYDLFLDGPEPQNGINIATSFAF